MEYKYWQVYLLLWGIPLMIIILAILGVELFRFPFNYYIVLLLTGDYIFNWAVVTYIHPMLSPALTIDLRKYKIIHPLSYALFSSFMLVYEHIDTIIVGLGLEAIEVLIYSIAVISILISVVLTGWTTVFAAKLLMRVTLGESYHMLKSIRDVKPYIHALILGFFFVGNQWIFMEIEGQKKRLQAYKKSYQKS